MLIELMASTTPHYPHLDFLNSRRSVPAKQLTEPAPNASQLRQLLAAASRVPDHGKRVPFRFIRIQGDQRGALGEALVDIHRRKHVDVSTTEIEKDRSRFASAPLIIAVVAVLDPEDTKIPDIERLLTAGAVCTTLLQAVHAMGYSAVWLTGWPAYDQDVHRLLGVKQHEQIVGFIHIGTAKIDVPERDRPDPEQLLSDWNDA